MSESAAKLKAWIVELSTENKTQQAVIEERGYMIESLKSDNARLTARCDEIADSLTQEFYRAHLFHDALEKKNAEVERLLATKNEMKAQLDVEVDLADKWWRECERLRKALESLRFCDYPEGSEVMTYIDPVKQNNIIDAALRGEE